MPWMRYTLLPCIFPRYPVALLNLLLDERKNLRIIIGVSGEMANVYLAQWKHTSMVPLSDEALARCQLSQLDSAIDNSTQGAENVDNVEYCILLQTNQVSPTVPTDPVY
jgi:hypothetical protein